MITTNWNLVITFLFFCAFCCSSTKGQILDENGGCQLIGLLPFTDEREGPPPAIAKEGKEYYGYGSWPDAQTLGKATFSLMAAAELAVQHFNNRDTAIVPQLADLGSCNIMFPDVFYHDSGYTRPMAVDAMLNRTFEGAIQGLDPTKVLCGVLGPTQPRSNEGVSSMTEGLHIPQVAYSTIDMRLSRRDDFLTLARIIPSSFDYATSLALYMQRDVVKRDYLAIIYEASDYGEQYEDPLEDAEDFLPDWATITEHVIEDIAEETLWDSLGEAAEEGYRTILLASDRIELLDTVASIADELGLIGEKYLWFFSADMITPALQTSLRYEKDSAVDRLLRGAGVFSNHDPFVYHGENDPFLQVWREQQGQELLDRLKELHPLSEDDPAYYVGGADYFQTEVPTEYASFLYDGVIATGISACKAQMSGTSHVDEMFQVNFDGASGHVQFKKDLEILEGLAKSKQSNGRDPEGVQFGMYNIRPQEEVDADGTRGYDVVLTRLYHGDEVIVNPEPGFEDVIIDGIWKPVEGEEFVYYDGTTEEPKPVRTTYDWNFMSKEIQTVGFCLMSLGLLIILITILWVFVMRNTRLVKASQPEFLYMMCFGSAMVSFSLFFVSFDEDKGWNSEELTLACGFFPWVFTLGYMIIYCALFSKLWRLSKLLSLRRRVVRMNQVLLPFAGFMVASIVVLALWTVLRPYKWIREDISEEEGVLVTYGECDSEGGVLPFVLPLGGIVFTVIGMTAVISWQMKDVQDELAESKWIFFGIASHIQFWLVGIPLFYILNDVSKDASYLIFAILSFIFSTSMVVLVIWPKIHIWARDTYFGGPAKPTTTLSLSGASTTHVSGIQAPMTSSRFGSNHSTGDQDKKRIEELEQEVKLLREEQSKIQNSEEAA